VLHPDARFAGFDTEHYPSWRELARRLGLDAARGSFVARRRDDAVVLPTEALHGLYDGGGGAGLAPYWAAIRDAPRGAGLFLWAFLDEGVVRTDQEGRIDTGGNRAPDGVVGPYREREGSVLALREIFSPLEVRLPWPLPAGFDGTVPVSHRYDHLRLAGRLRWQWLGAPRDDNFQALEVVAAGAVSLSSLPPGEAGAVRVPRPPAGSRALRLTYVDGGGERRAEWSVPVAAEPARWGLGAGRAERTAGRWTLTGPETFAAFDDDGTLRELVLRGRPVPLTGGAPLPPPDDAIPSLSAPPSGGLLVESPGRRVRWAVPEAGSLRLEYVLDAAPRAPFEGVGFRFPSAAMRSVHWLGGGPYRVWANRTAGSRFGIWRRRANRTVTGESWRYPELPGYYRDVRSVMLETVEGAVRLVIEGAPYVQLFTPPAWSEPLHATAPFPAADLSLLHRIPAIGTKFHAPAELAPPGDDDPRPATHRGAVTFSVPRDG
jgi:hypothetical protein